MNYKKYGIIMAVIGIILIIVGITKLFPKKQANTETINNTLNDSEIQAMLKSMEKYLKVSQDINNHTEFSLNEMIQFTFSYIDYFDEEDKIAQIDEEKTLGIVDVDTVKEKINYLFGIENIDISKSEYEVKEGKIYIPLNLQGGDLQIYKYVETLKTNKDSEYIAVIDCLEPTSAEDMSTLLSVSEYDKDAVIMTLKIRYKIVDSRKILLAYSAEVNM